MRFFLGLLALASAWAFQTDSTHFSQVMNGNRTYRVFLPASYANSQKRYPVLYWFHGYEQSSETEAYSKDLADYVAAHDLIVIDLGPVETTGEFPLYFPELVDRVDKTLRTLPDRDHRAVTGYSAGGFMAFFEAAKFPDMVSSASSIMGPTEYPVGPKDLDVECNEDDLSGNLDGIRTRLVTGSGDFIRFYHRRLNSIWTFAGANHETEELDSAHAPAGVAKTLDFHMHAFANPLPKPATFNHADVYPNFSVWSWEVASERTQPAFTVLENVSPTGFRSAVREWIPGGAAITSAKLSITTPPKLFAPGSVHTVTYIHLRDGKLRRASQKADPQGRLTFDLDGDAYEVGISPESVITVSGYEIAGAPWATAGAPVKVRVRFLNKGAARSATLPLTWETPNAGVKLESTPSRLFGLAPGEAVAVPVSFTVTDPARAVAKLVAVAGAVRIPIDIPLYPPADPVKVFQIADGRTVPVYQHAVKKEEVPFGEGNGDGFAAPGETFAILIPDGDTLRAAEIVAADPCVDLSIRASDSWTDYDHTGASAKYSLPRIRPECEPGLTVHLLARIVLPNAPNHQVRYAAIEFPIWWRHPEDAVKK